MYYIAIGLLGALCMFNMSSIFGKNSGAISAWPAPLLFLFILIVHVIVPILKYDFASYRWMAAYPDEVAVPQVLLLICACALLTIAVRLSLASSDKRAMPLLKAPTNFNAFILVTYAVGAAFCLRDLQLIAQMGGVDVYLGDRIGSGDERGSGRMLGFFMATAIVAYAYVNCRVMTSKKALILAGMCALPLYYYTVLTSRNSIIFILMLVAFAMLVPRRIPISVNKRLFGALLSIAVLAYGGSALLSLSTESRIAGRESARPVWLRSADGAFGNDEALLWHALTSRDLAFGQTYLASAVAWVPRSIWEGKPTGGGPYLVNLIHPGKYVVGKAGNSSYTTGMFVEAILNFGMAGYFLIVLGWAWAAATFVRLALAARTVEAQLMWIIATFTLSTSFVYMEFLGFVARVGTLLFPILVWLFFKKAFSTSHSPSSQRRG